MSIPGRDDPPTPPAQDQADLDKLAPMARLLQVMRRLRDPNGGCPWDIEQTFETIAPYTIEEAYEVADAIERGDRLDLKEELGDLLLQVVYHSRMAEEEGAFAFMDVADAIATKMIARHPHVFSDAKIDDAHAQTAAWEAAKAEERERKSGKAGVLDNIPLALPALVRAEKLQKRAARVGFDWPEARLVLDKIKEEIGELEAEIEADTSDRQDRMEDELGDVLFAIANLARHLKIDPESALKRTNKKFERRFRSIEQALANEGRTVTDASLDEMEHLWQVAKKSPRKK